MSRRPVKRKGIAILLAIFGGWIGAHRFYLREGGAGIFYIMLFLFTASMRMPVTTIFSLFDAFRILMMSPKQFDRMYNSGREEALNRRRVRSKSERDLFEERKRQQSTKSIKRVNPYKSTGINKYKEYDLEGAIDDFQKGLKIEPRDTTIHFNLACAYSMQEENDKSLYHLNEAVLNGFDDFEKINSHEDLAFLRIQPKFEKYRANGFKMDGKIKVNERNLLEDDILLSQLNKLSELRKKGLLSDEEFVIEKKKLMSR